MHLVLVMGIEWEWKGKRRGGGGEMKEEEGKEEEEEEEEEEEGEEEEDSIPHSRSVCDEAVGDGGACEELLEPCCSGDVVVSVGCYSHTALRNHQDLYRIWRHNGGRRSYC
ncbi:hypothetical protein Hamer_G021802 [Homarus americanus]|uniref:Uncharacterized protein n=1 Tax=Homarus americanus TaxID=6706 RepID=A0A8J5MY66_HOMAM|nr:hypothetical protein Hamer_G021802 [Homarus americanus]